MSKFDDKLAALVAAGDRAALERLARQHARKADKAEAALLSLGKPEKKPKGGRTETSSGSRAEGFKTLARAYGRTDFDQFAEECEAGIFPSAATGADAQRALQVQAKHYKRQKAAEAEGFANWEELVDAVRSNPANAGIVKG